MRGVKSKEAEEADGNDHTIRALTLANSVPYSRFNVHEGLTRTKMDERGNTKKQDRRGFIHRWTNNFDRQTHMSDDKTLG